MKFAELKDGDKVVDIIQEDGERLDGQILEYKKYGEKGYLCSQRSMWEIYQFNENDFERYYGDLPVGSYIE